MQPHPSLPLLGLLLAWITLCEIGGQNIPADWNDIDEDRGIGARTIPLALGPRGSGWLVVITLSLTVICSLFLPLMSPLKLGAAYLLISAMAGVVLLVWPAVGLLRSGASRQAARLFDHASYYPLAQLALIAIFVFMPPSWLEPLASEPVRAVQ